MANAAETRPQPDLNIVPADRAGSAGTGDADAPTGAEPGAAGGRGGAVEIAPLLQDLREELKALRRETEANPFANPVQLLALRLGRRLDDGSLTLEMVERLIQELTLASFAHRAKKLRAYLGIIDPESNRGTLRQLFETLAQPPAAEGEDGFARLQSALGCERFGIVITAHPTFALAKDLADALVARAFGGEAELDRSREHRPDRPLDLDVEHEQSVAAIDNLQTALHVAYRIVFEVARDHHPGRWHELEPRLLTFASWVGYDLDGRSDIPWTATFAKRLRLQALQLGRYRASARALRRRAGTGPVGDLLELLEARVALAIKQAEDEIAVFEGDAGDETAFRKRIATAARTMHKGHESRLVSAAPLLDLVRRAIALVGDAEPDLRLDLCVLRAEIGTHGLGLAHTHVRLNARQLHNAIRKTVGMDHAPDDPSHRLSYLTAISREIGAVQPTRINFGSLLAEKATAKRVFMIIAQMLKYVDADRPIRFLIAEAETGFTLLTALYFAKLFDVEDRIEISPLFETGSGLEHGARILGEALEDPGYRRYVQRRGRVCIQTGYSDAGRYLGQVAASHAIESLRFAVARELARQGLEGIELVIFDTHGESIGRGGHPESFADRLLYVDTPHARQELKSLGITYKQEVSFQGGDGYLHFNSEPSALAALTRILEHVLDPAPADDDPFYRKGGYVHEFFTAIRRFHSQIMEDSSYGALLGTFGPNLLYRSGSRPVRRQHDNLSGQINLSHPTQLRAIPHNAILQQLGFLANSVGGLGAAVAKHPDQFQELYDHSARFRRLMTMVEHAFKFSDLAVLKAYIDLFDPALWLMRAARRRGDQRGEELTLVAEMMDRTGLHPELKRIWRVFVNDHMHLSAALREHRRRTRDAGIEPIAVDAETRDRMHQLHALRLMLIQRLYLLAVHVPEFSGQHELTRESLIARLIQLDVEEALARLEHIFPILESEAGDEDFGEPATYESAENQSYGEEHARIFQPMAEHYALIRRIGTAVVHNIGALG